MSEIKLKSCPFCGGEARVMPPKGFVSYVAHYWVSCKNCHVQTDFVTSRKEAMEAWNRRAGEQNE